MKQSLELYDVTLRDGLQREGLSLSVEDKLKIARRLDAFGIHYIEGGFPAANPKEMEFFKRLGAEGLSEAKLVGFGMTRRAGTQASQDLGLRKLLECNAPVLCVVGKNWQLHVKRVLGVSPEENLQMISQTVSFLKASGREVFFDSEHFFDGYKDDPDYALKTLEVAADAGATRLILCDTNGATLPHEVSQIVGEVVKSTTVPLGIHCHNDSDCATANSLAAVQAGVRQVQGTVNGYGERCGNADLVSIIPALVLKLGYPVLDSGQLSQLTQLSHYIAEVANITPEAHHPYVGSCAFAHKAGMHISAAVKDSRTFEHIDPEKVGNRQRILISELAGRRTVEKKVKDMGLELAGDPKAVERALYHLKEREHLGYHYEAAEASFELLMRRELGRHSPLFTLESFRVITEKHSDGAVTTEATIKLHIGKRRLINTAEGNGPVNALDNALRGAITKTYPALRGIHLTNYKVRILNENKGTAASTRVLLDSSDGRRQWGTMGVSDNIIEASWEALLDSLEYGLQPNSALAPHLAVS